jgi:hypothetical protein
MVTKLNRTKRSLQPNDVGWILEAKGKGRTLIQSQHILSSHPCRVKNQSGAISLSLTVAFLRERARSIIDSLRGIE